MITKKVNVFFIINNQKKGSKKPNHIWKQKTVLFRTYGTYTVALYTIKYFSTTSRAHVASNRIQPKQKPNLQF